MENYTMLGSNSLWLDLVLPKSARNKKAPTTRAEMVLAHETNTIQPSPSGTKTETTQDKIRTPEKIGT
ncbi:hypothetical protein RHGRI_032079 [Rhododendron griersonianum]|uniref:Uncharacterized protein n=1 Tax=Rhododendron griersonianum TaxID=479676 RepID=A0AAV6IAK8_9ERIC|nr:hypothetical protein RHGRI_032079 [Rhododendron griersonianum]